MTSEIISERDYFGFPSIDKTKFDCLWLTRLMRSSICKIFNNLSGQSCRPPADRCILCNILDQDVILLWLEISYWCRKKILVKKIISFNQIFICFGKIVSPALPVKFWAHHNCFLMTYTKPQNECIEPTVCFRNLVYCYWTDFSD